jgi:hypothetical protein
MYTVSHCVHLVAGTFGQETRLNLSAKLDLTWVLKITSIRIRNNALQETFRKSQCSYWHVMYPVFVLSVCGSGSIGSRTFRAGPIRNYFQFQDPTFLMKHSVGTGS